MDSIIDKLERAKHNFPDRYQYHHPRSAGFNEGVEAAIAIVRQHGVPTARSGQVGDYPPISEPQEVGVYGWNDKPAHLPIYDENGMRCVAPGQLKEAAGRSTEGAKSLAPIALGKCTKAIKDAWRTADKCNATQDETEEMLAIAILETVGVDYVD